MKYPTLVTPITVNSITFPNRMVMPPLVIWKAGRDGLVTEDHLAHYRSCRGPGLLIVEATVVSPEGRLAATQLGIFDDAQLPGLKDLARTISENGSIPGIQLHHAGAKTDTRKTYGLTPLAPSKLEEHDGTIEELTEDQILRIIDDFGAAAERAVQAGFRVLEIHGAHGYLGSQFLSPRANRRRDRWGGSLENRTRFLTSVYRKVRECADDSVIVSCRLGVAEGIPGGLSLEEGIQAAEILRREGIDLLNISHGGSIPRDAAPEESSFSPLLHLARAVRERVSVPLIGIGDIRTPQQAESALENGMADMIAVGRGVLADPGWMEKTLSGQENSISVCRDCKPRCFQYSMPEKCPARKKLR